MAAAMNGLDALVFTGGVGEHAGRVRAEAAAGLGFLGIRLAGGQEEVSSDADISAAESPVKVLVITAREDVEIARQARAVLAEASR
jgi:acetate kinase